MNDTKDHFLKRMEKIKEDIEIFKKIDFSGFDEIDAKEYSRIVKTIDGLLDRYEKNQMKLSDLFSKELGLTKAIRNDG